MDTGSHSLKSWWNFWWCLHVHFLETKILAKVDFYPVPSFWLADLIRYFHLQVGIRVWHYWVWGTTAYGLPSIGFVWELYIIKLSLFQAMEVITSANWQIMVDKRQMESWLGCKILQIRQCGTPLFSEPFPWILISFLPASNWQQKGYRLWKGRSVSTAWNIVKWFILNLPIVGLVFRVI